MTPEAKERDMQTQQAEPPAGPPRPRFSLNLSHLIAMMFVCAVVLGAGVALQPQEAGLPGLFFLAGVTVIAALFFHLLSSGQWSSDLVPPRLFALALDSDPQPACITGSDGAALYANRAWRRVFGRTPTGAIVLPVTAFSQDSDSAQGMYRLVRAASHGKAHQEELRYRGPAAGSALVTATPLGARGYTIWRVADVTAKRQSQTMDASQRQNVVVQLRSIDGKPKEKEPMLPLGAPSDVASRIQRYIADAPVGIALLDADGRVIECNHAIARIAGTALPGMRLRLFSDFLTEPSAAEFCARLSHSEEAGSTLAPADVRFKQTADRTAQLYVSRISTANADNKDPAAVIYLVDTTGQTKLENQFAQNQKMQAVGQLAGGIAHDFNNLLTVINGAAEFLMQRHPPGDPSFEDVNQISATCMRAAGLVRQLLAFSRRQDRTPEIMSMTDVVSDWTQTLRRVIGERVSLKVEHGRDLWPVMADPNQIGNVLMNLVVNARDAMPSGGTLIIRTANQGVAEARMFGQVLIPAGEYLSIEVEDTGIGIPQESLSKIFEPFYTTKEKGHGTGLGLATVYGIVKQTGGFIFAESEVGKGTVFRIFLPRYRDADRSVDAGPAPAAPLPEKPMQRDLTGHGTILLVEDEEAVRDFAARALTQRGYKVTEAGNGEEALEHLRDPAKTFDLLMSDVVMPGMDGPTLVKTVRNERPDMRIMFMSGYFEEAFENAGERMADFHFLPKPFSLKQLTAKVKDVLSAPVRPAVAMTGEPLASPGEDTQGTRTGPIPPAMP